VPLLPPAFLGPAPAAAAPTAQAAQEFVRTLGDEVIELLRGEVGDEERRARLIEILNEGTNLDLVGRLVLGQHWRTAEPAQREEYTELFRRFVMQNLASRLDSYQGQSYTITGAQVVDDRDAVVAARITRPGSPPLRVDWRLRETDGRLAIIDVIVEGVSMVVSQRAEFASVIGNSGMEGLLARLRQQVNGGPA
jgi:phospholipid transport system substrate-binding protein